MSTPSAIVVHGPKGKRLLFVDSQVKGADKLIKRMAKTNSCIVIAFNSADPKHNMEYLIEKIVEVKQGLEVLPQSENRTSYSEENPDNWHETKLKFDGTFQGEFKKEHIKGQPMDGYEKFTKNPTLYMGIVFKKGEENYTLIPRSPVTKLIPNGVSEDGKFMLATKTYSPLTPLKKDRLPKDCRDKYTDASLMHYYTDKKKKAKMVMPGRGMGLLDQPNLKFMGSIDPSDIMQGKVADCWLLAAISSLAAFEGGIRRLFRKTMVKNPKLTIHDTPNKYIVTLYDISKWEEVHIEIDERLCAIQDSHSGQGENMLLGAKPSADGELWVPYLEKAVAIHCGGWDKISNAGNCTHAWAILTGVKEQCTILRSGGENSKWICCAAYDPSQKKFADLDNDPRKGCQSRWDVPWPETDGTDRGRKTFADFKNTEEKTDVQLFDQMCEWEKSNFLMACSSKHTVTTNGIIAKHAYCVANCMKDVAGTKEDMIQLRNPWGRANSKGETGILENGHFSGETGPGWKQHSNLKKKLKPDQDATGVFWLTRKEFFEHFDKIYLCARNMGEFLGPSRNKRKANGSDKSIPDNVMDKKKKSKKKSTKVKEKGWSSIGIALNQDNALLSLQNLPGTLHALTGFLKDGDKVFHILWCKTPKDYPGLSPSQVQTATELGFQVITTSIMPMLYEHSENDAVSRLYLKERKNKE